MQQATLNIQIRVRSSNGRSDVVIPKGSKVNFESRGSYVNIIYNDGNYRFNASIMNSLTVHEPSIGS